MWKWLFILSQKCVWLFKVDDVCLWLPPKSTNTILSQFMSKLYKLTICESLMCLNEGLLRLLAWVHVKMIVVRLFSRLLHQNVHWAGMLLLCATVLCFHHTLSVPGTRKCRYGSLSLCYFKTCTTFANFSVEQISVLGHLEVALIVSWSANNVRWGVQVCFMHIWVSIMHGLVPFGVCNRDQTRHVRV